MKEKEKNLKQVLLFVFIFFIFFLLNLTSNSFAQKLPEGLVFHVTFDGCQVVDETGHVSQFEIHGSPQCVSGIKGDAFYFDGDDWIGADIFFPIADGTIILFVKFSQRPAPGETWFLIDSKTNFRSSFFASFPDNSSHPIIRIGYPDTEFSQDFTNKWLMLTIVYYNGNTRQGKRIAYLNGQKVGEQTERINEYTIPWYADDRTQNLNIGVSDWYDGFLKNAAIDEIMFFDRPLSQAEIRQIYEKYASSNSSQNSYFWDFDSQDDFRAFGWSFFDDSHKGANFCPDPYSSLEVRGGIAHLHSHSSYGKGKLNYSFDAQVSPQEISIGYNFSYSSSGSCGRVIFSFFDSNDQEILRYDFNYDAWGPYSWFRAYFKGQKQDLAFDTKYKAGVVKWQFQNGLINLYWNDQLLTTFPYNNLSEWKIAKIVLTLGNSCCDGRNDSYLDIDFVKIVPAETSSPENNHPPTKPQISGPSEGKVGQSLSFSASASDPDGDPLSYQFDWGDGSPSGWGERTQNHSWSREGRYCVKIRAKDSHGATSEWSDCLNVNIRKVNHVPTKPRIDGPSEGTVGQNLTFTASASDPDGDPLSYQFDWGDGSPSGWGERTQNHSWSREGRYCVKIRAKDSHGATSEWSDCLNVSISPSSTNPQLLAYYSFDQCDIHDDSGNGHDGWSHGNLGCVDGVKGKALYFDGASWVDLPDFFEGYPYVSVCAWIKKENLHSGRQSIIDGWKDAETFHISWSDGYAACGDLNKNFTGFNFGVHPGHPGDEYDPERHICGSEGGSEDWTFVCGVFDGQKLYLYENAQLISTYSYLDHDRYLNYSDSDQWNRPGPDLRLGISRHNAHFFTGYLDELRIYNYPLSQSEIQQLYLSSKPTDTGTTEKYTLNISKTGAGQGRITSNTGLECESSCSDVTQSLPEGTQVTLQAFSDSGSVFEGWGGDCSFCGESSVCSFILDSDKFCTAEFGLENKQRCSSDNLELCNNESDCLAAGGYWCDNRCQKDSCCSLSVPTGLRFDILDYGYYKLLWNPVSGASGYEVCRSISPNFESGKTICWSISDTSFKFYLGSSNYYHRVRAVSDDCHSPWSEIETMDKEKGHYAEILGFEVPVKVEVGEKLRAKVRVKNESQDSDNLYIGFSVRTNNGKVYDLPPQRVYFRAWESKEVAFEWDVPEGVATGSAQAVTAVWEEMSGNRMVGELDRMEKSFVIEKGHYTAKILRLDYHKDLYGGNVAFVCEISNENGRNFQFIWEIKKEGSLVVDRKITKENEIFYKFNELADYSITCKLVNSDGKEIDRKTIRFSFPNFLAEYYAPVLLFSERGDKANPELAQHINLLKSLLEHLLPHKTQLAINLTEDAIFKHIPEYEYFYPTSVDNFLKHLSNDGCLDKNYLDEVKGNIDKQQPLTVYYYIKDTGDKIILEYWMFYLYNEILDYPSYIIDYIPFNHQGDWEGIAFILNKDNYTIHRAIFYQHEGYEEIDASQVSWYVGGHPAIFVALGTHASYPDSGVNIFNFNVKHPVLDRHYGEYIYLSPHKSNGDFNRDSRTYVLVNLKDIETELEEYYKWGCNGNSPTSPLFQQEKLTDPYAYINKLRGDYPDPYLENFQFYPEGDYITLKVNGTNKGSVGIAYLSVALEATDLRCSDIKLEKDVKCYDREEEIWCSYGQERCVLKYPHVEKVKKLKRDNDITLEIKVPKNKILDQIFYIDLKFIASDLKEQHWVYTPHIKNLFYHIVKRRNPLPFCDVIDQQNEHAFRTFVLRDGNYEKYLYSSYICHNNLYVPVTALYYKGKLYSLIGFYVDLSTLEIKTIRNLGSLEVNYPNSISFVTLIDPITYEEIGQLYLKHVVLNNKMLGAKFKITLEENTIKLDLKDYWFEND